MATPFRLKRSAISGKRPSLSDLQLGEIALNTYDGYLFAERDTGGIGIGTTVSLLTPWTETYGSQSIYYSNLVGIGTENPTSKLHVIGNTVITGILTAASYDGELNNLGNTYYVAENGSDSHTGTNINQPFATIKYALSLAVAGDTIFVQSGTFTEIFPLTVPAGVTVRGVGLRGTFIQPTAETKQNDGFLLNGDTTVEDLTIGNFFEPGYGFKFAPGKKSTSRSPYVQRVTVLNKGSVTSLTDPYGFDTAHSPPTSYKAGRGALIDGSAVDPDTLEPAMLFNECTFICPNNIALEMTNGARSEWVNCFTYFADKGIYAHDGAVGVGSTGYVRIKTSGFSGTTPTANDELYYLESNSQSGTYAQVGTALTITRVGHGLTVGDRIFADFTSGTATDGFYRVTGYVGVNTFSVTMAGSATTSGNISYKEALGFGTVRNYTSSSGLSSITGKGEGLFELPSSRLGKTITAFGDAQLSTSQEKFGTASLLLDGTGDYARCEGSTDFAFAGNFTVEAWIYPTSVTGSRYLFSLGTETTGRYNLALVSGVLTGNFYGSASTTFGGSISTGSWTHIALVRSGSTITVYVDGTALGTTETNSSAIGNSGQLTIGADTSGTNNFAGYIDELRISNIARYTGTFTPATSQFNSDGSDKLLLHFDGVTGSTSFTDSSIPVQDVRWVRSGVGIATATRITLADYQQFGAEMRSIGSAVVFGNTGISADGPGVGLRLFAFNFGHIGSGKDFSQDISLVNQADEVVKTNNAKVYFVSIDQSGDFRVGDAFYVNQEEGTVNFGGENFTLNSLSNLNITDGTNTSTLTPTYLTVGNLQLSGNEITSTSGDITINPAGSSVTNISGDLVVSGILTASVLQADALQLGDTSIAIDDTGSNGTIRFNTDGAEALRITNVQNVGIGITNPTSKLSVSGDTSVSGLTTTNNLYVAGVGTFLPSGLKIRNAANTFQYNITGGAITADRTLNLPVITGTDTVATLGVIQTFTAAQTFSGVLSGTGTLSLTGSATGIHRFGTSQTSASITIGGSSGTGLITLGNSTDSQWTDIQANATSSGNIKTIRIGTGGLSGSNTRIDIGPTAGVGTVAINAGTNLGIGSATPTSKLDVVGDAKFTGVVTATSFIGSLSGTATNANYINISSQTLDDNVYYVPFESGIGYTSLYIDTALYYNPGQNLLTITNLQGTQINVSQNVNVSGIATVGNIQFNTLTNSRKITTINGQPLTIESSSGTVYLDSNFNITGRTDTANIFTSGDINATGIVTASTRLSTGVSGVGINITQSTISGPSELIIDPAAVGDNTGLVRIKGDLYVDGTTTQINSTTLEIADFIVGIASTATTDLLADGAGIKIGPDNTLTYDYANTALKSSENFNLASGKTYKINGTDVLSSTTLGSAVVNSSLTSVGTLGQLNVSGVSTLTGNVSFGSSAFFGDNDRLNFGDSNDLQIWHNGTNSLISDSGTGDLYIGGNNNVVIASAAFSEDKARFITNGAVELYYDNVKEFETTGYGATVFGTLETQGLNVTGVSTLSGNVSISGIVTATGTINSQNDIQINGVSVLTTASADAVALAIALG